MPFDIIFHCDNHLDYIPLFLDFYDRYCELTYEERGRLVWAMLAHARGEDPAPHLTGALRKYSFPNERDLIDRTEKVHVERKERRRAASQVANAAKKKHTESDRNGAERTESDRIGPNRAESEHNNNNNHNNNHNYNNNNNYNNNDNREEGARTHGKDRRSEAGRTVPIGRETIL